MRPLQAAVILGTVMLVAGVLLTLLISSRKLPSESRHGPAFALRVAGEDSNMDVEPGQTDMTLLAFWATWCPSCGQHISELNRWQEKYGASGLRILGINTGEPADKVTGYIQEKGISYPVLLDRRGHVSDAYEVSGVPTFVLLAKDFEILYYGFGLPNHLENSFSDQQ